MTKEANYEREDLLALIERVTVCTTTSCSPEDSERYWNAFQGFLTSSGIFARTWHLFRQIKDNPDEKNLQKMRNAGYKNQAELSNTLEKQALEYGDALDELIKCSEKVNIPLGMNSKLKNDLLLNFVLLDDETKGACRRSYYREFSKHALQEIEQKGFSKPISILDVEDYFSHDKTWQRNFFRKKRRKK